MKKPIGTKGLVCSALLLLPLLSGGCTQPGGEEAAEEYAALEEKFREALSEATSGEDWDMDDYRAVYASFESRFEELADTYWGTEAALDAKLWLLGRQSYQEDEEVGNAAREAILKAIFMRYSGSPLMVKVVGFYWSATQEQRETYFSRLQKRSPHAEVRAAVIFAVVNIADMDLASSREDVDREAARETRRTNLHLLADKYADIPYGNSTYGERAELMLSAHDPADLEIGRKAPEIIGTDVDGNEMKLSDYLGKVVVIDFWGDW